jgi:asparagine synthase (glutamine-hydrolysing)
VVHAYEEYGRDCVTRFRGMFAFASEIKALLEHPAISTEFDESVLREYLVFGYISDERTFCRGTRKLMPAHHLTLDLRAASPEPDIVSYWEVPRFGEHRQDYGCRSDQDWIRETRRRLEETVRMRLMSDVPLGLFLSGGVDSGAIAALVKRNADGPVKTFSVGYSETQYSELSLAAETARTIGTDHHEVRIGMDEFFDTLPE